MATYGELKTRIADELHRSDLLASGRIAKAVLSAVAFYERRRFYFSESSFTFATVAGTETYGSSAAAEIATSPNIERLNGLINGTRTPIDKVDWQSIDDKSALTSSRAAPSEWAYRANEIRLYPIPDRAYTITAYNVPRLTAPSAEEDENVWTTEEEAGELIRLRAKRLLIRDHIGLTGREKEYLEMSRGEQDALSAIIRETTSREATGQLEPSEF